jgi:hypothetical protein
MSESIIRIDRSTSPVYPDWVTRVLHPELGSVGPAEYDLATIGLWLHDGQKNDAKMHGDRIYGYLKSENMLGRCLGLRDGEEIRKKGVRIFRTFFGGRSLFLWKSVVEFNGDLRVPAIPYGGEGDIRWVWLGFDWRSIDPAGLHRSR